MKKVRKVGRKKEKKSCKKTEGIRGNRRSQDGRVDGEQIIKRR